MTEWIQEINWLLIIMVSVGSLAGSEIGRRFSVNPSSEVFQPVWSYRLLALASLMSISLFYESAKVAVKLPTAFHVWMLIFATAMSFIFCAIIFGLELHLAKRVLKQMARETGERNGQN